MERIEDPQKLLQLYQFEKNHVFQKRPKIFNRIHQWPIENEQLATFA